MVRTLGLARISRQKRPPIRVTTGPLRDDARPTAQARRGKLAVVPSEALAIPRPTPVPAKVVMARREGPITRTPAATEVRPAIAGIKRIPRDRPLPTWLEMLHSVTRTRGTPAIGARRPARLGTARRRVLASKTSTPKRPTYRTAYPIGKAMALARPSS